LSKVMFKTILILEAKAFDIDKNSQLTSFWYKEVFLPFIPIHELKICFTSSEINPILETVSWNADENYFICDCIEKCNIENIGSNQFYKDYPKFIQTKYIENGWAHLEVDDNDQIIQIKDLNAQLSHFGFAPPLTTGE